MPPAPDPAAPRKSDPGRCDPRLPVLRDALRGLRNGEFNVRVPIEPGAGELAALAQEIEDLAGWLDQRFTEFERLRNVAEEFTQGLFVDDVLERLFDTFRPLIPYNRIGCALLSDGGAKVVTRWAKSDYATVKLRRGHTASLDETSLGAVLASGQPRILNDLVAYQAQNPRSTSTRLALVEGIRSSLTCPLIARGKPIGLLFFSSFEPDTYRDLHQGLFMYIAGQLSSLLDRSQLYQQVFELNAQLSEAHRALQEHAMRDTLTGCLNRGAICDLLGTELNRAARQGGPVAVAMVDIDWFKRVNDTCGHLGGDTVLRAVARALRDGVREYDHVGRYGGEEFLIVLPGTDLAQAGVVAERAREKVASLRFDAELPDLHVSVSIGVAVADAPGPGGAVCDVDALLTQADRRLYRAKDCGRDRVVAADA